MRSASEAQECNFPKPIVVPAGDYFMLGDNRRASDDSRFWGPVKRSWIIGVVTP
jgi:signal peptidase I